MELKEGTIHISTASIVKAIAIILFVAMIFVLKDLVLVLLMSIIIASAVEPATQWFSRRKVPRTLAVILIYLIVFSFLIGAIYLIVVPLLRESGDFLRNFNIYFNANSLTNSLSQSSFFSSQPLVAELQNSFDLESIIKQINNIVVGLSSDTFGTVTNVFGGILSFVLIIVLSFYLSVERDGVGKFLKIVTPVKHERYIVTLWERSQRKIGLWMQGQLVLAIIVGMLVYLGLLIIGMPNALLLAALAAILEIIPLFGPIIASIPAVFIGFSSGGFAMAILVIGLYVIIQQFENQLIYPMVVKKVVGLPPVISIVALIAGWELGGFLGFILSVPIASAVIEYIDDRERSKSRDFQI